MVIVKLCDLVWPSTTLPKLKLAAESDNVGCTPVPLTGIVSGDPDELLVTVRVPETAPAALGANVTVNVTCPDGLTVAGTVTPLTENPVPVMATAEIDAAAVPVFVTTICLAELVFVAMFPKLNAV